ncbi:glycosyltransferase family 4 protein [Aneurinibacillus thermoaerophilus]|uniref:Glycosyltransferase involved in cell wall bisynthesis n=1 Tax=Aneurinibacillus thermoaerophilus TaxID=143495 RepID=A0A1G7ZBT7_ANETH|nr:glycosyltransferase family 4 protein [Aneurinibacillus thermoaerophilus]MED0757153.1 glycosyltransferase family 4 protein [Aneurinibacillus thermoaerophilus]MED0759326.1 glycosyltransferase family 4 protein [Aneurinibacillus thermoaerophilus]SDH06158.1 Glycosyltransferase involved in cell wall bisynthesis [Aneurinibacillus thermoaerophilus]
MDILIVAPPMLSVSETTGGSVEISIYQTAKRLALQNNVTIISRKSNSLPRISESGNLTIVRVPGGKGYVRNVIHYIKSHKFDCIQVDNRPRFIPILRRHFPNIPLVLVLHSLTFMNFLTIKEKHDVIRKSTAIICNSQFLRNYYASKFPHYENKITAIHLGTDLSRFRKPTPEEKSDMYARYALPSSFIILYAGRIIPGKGVHILIKAASLVKKTIPSVRLVLVGPYLKGYKARLMREAKRRKVPVLFTGSVKPSVMYKMYWLGDCFVFPTQFHEAFGLVSVEAMASELPVIASRRGGVVEIINGQNGILILDYKNPVAFAKEINKIFNEPAYAKKLAEVGRKTVLSHFSWERVAADYQQFYTKILQK